MNLTNLIKCSRCHSELLAEYFAVNRKGVRRKCCKNCLNRFKCLGCDYKTSYKSNLNKHIKIVHDKIKDFACSQCDYKCSTNRKLKDHMKAVHDKIKDFACSQCEFKCSTNGHLKRHVKAVHDKVKDVACDKCEFKCSTKSDIKQHIKQVHDKIKDFACDKCDYTCSTNGHLKRHVKICTGESSLSSGEFRVKQVLDQMGISHEYNSTHVVKDKGLLRWDFIIRTTDEPLFIEYDGKQHFQSIPYWGGDEGLKNSQRRDKIKDDYCNDNGYLLLRIPYHQYGQIEQLVSEFIINNTNWGFE